MTEIPDRVRALARERDEARAARDFARADAIRDEIAAAGFAVRDTPQGAVLEPAQPIPRYEIFDPSRVPERLEQPPTFDLSLHLLYEGFRDDLERFLGALAKHIDPERTEVVAVDNGGRDADWLEDVVTSHPNGRVVHIAPVQGWATARNAGLRSALGRVCALADLSIEPTGDIVGPLTAAFEDRSVGVAGPFGLVSDDMRSWRDSPGPEVDAIEGYLIAVRRDALAKGLIHDKFRWYRNADIDLSFQVRALGYRALVVPLPVERHTHRGWTSVDEAQREKLSKRNHYIFFDRWKHHADLLLAKRA